MNSFSKILVTGASGFIGLQVIQEIIRRNLSYIAVSRRAPRINDIAWHALDLSDIAAATILLRQHSPASIVHLAWDGIPNLSEVNSFANYKTSRDFLKTAIELGAKKIVLAGSCLEYGSNTGQISETASPINPSPFGRLKRELFHEIAAHGHSYDCEVINAPIFFAFGPGQRAESLVPCLFQAIVSNDNIPLREPTAAQDFVEINDVATALIELLLNQSVRTGIYNIARGELIAVATVANQLATLLGRQIDLPLPPVLAGSYANIEKLKDIGWTPKYGLEAGLARYCSEQYEKLKATS